MLQRKRKSLSRSNWSPLLKPKVNSVPFVCVCKCVGKIVFQPLSLFFQEKEEDKPEWADAAKRKKEFVKEQLEELNKGKGEQNRVVWFLTKRAASISISHSESCF